MTMGVATPPRDFVHAELAGTNPRALISASCSLESQPSHRAFAGRHDFDCSQFLLISSGGNSNTSELETKVRPANSNLVFIRERKAALSKRCFGQVAIRFMLAEPPRHNVMCTLTVDPPTEASVTPFRLEFSPINASVAITVVVQGVRDWRDENDTQYVVRVSKCISLDPRFHGMGWPEAPEVTELHFVNANVEFPIVREIVPDAIRPSGSAVTVRGRLFNPSARMFVGGYVLADLATYPWPFAFDESARRRAEKRWLWLNNTAKNRMQPISVDELGEMGIDHASGNASFCHPEYNATLCSKMADLGLYNPSASATEQDLNAFPNRELSDLLQFQWHTDGNETSCSFITPCLPANRSEVTAAALRSALRGRRLELGSTFQPVDRVLLNTAPPFNFCALVQMLEQRLIFAVVLRDARFRSPFYSDGLQYGIEPPILKDASSMLSTSCQTPPNIALVLDGECQPCPMGAECPGLPIAAPFLSPPLACGPIMTCRPGRQARGEYGRRPGTGTTESCPGLSRHAVRRAAVPVGSMGRSGAHRATKLSTARSVQRGTRI